MFRFCCVQPDESQALVNALAVMADGSTLFAAHEEMAQMLLGGLTEGDSWAEQSATLACSAHTLASAAKMITWLVEAQVCDTWDERPRCRCMLLACWHLPGH